MGLNTHKHNSQNSIIMVLPHTPCVLKVMFIAKKIASRKDEILWCPTFTISINKNKNEHQKDTKVDTDLDKLLKPGILPTASLVKKVTIQIKASSLPKRRINLSTSRTYLLEDDLQRLTN